jgi:hypothetical protein
MYEDYDLYDIITGRTKNQVSQERKELVSAINLCKPMLSGNLEALELFCGIESRYAESLKKVGVNVVAQIDILKHDKTSPKVTIGDVLTHKFNRKFDIIYDPWENFALLNPYCEKLFAENVARHLKNDGIFLQCIWEGVNSSTWYPSKGLCTFNLPANCGMRKRYNLRDKAYNLLVEFESLNNGAFYYEYYHNIWLLPAKIKYSDRDRASSIEHWKVKLPVRLSDSNIYNYIKEFSSLQFKCYPIAADSRNPAFLSKGEKKPRFMLYTKIEHPSLSGFAI